MFGRTKDYAERIPRRPRTSIGLTCTRGRAIFLIAQKAIDAHMTQVSSTHSPPPIENRIVTIRAMRVIIDSDLAALYGVTTKRLNEQVKRNAVRFPDDFMFRLTTSETAEVVANCDHLGNLRFSHVPPRAFTEYGAIQAANVLGSTQAVTMGIFVVRAFVRMRQLAVVNDDLAKRISELEAA